VINQEKREEIFERAYVVQYPVDLDNTNIKKFLNTSGQRVFPCRVIHVVIFLSRHLGEEFY
jgi:hypothetical protein